MKGKFAPYSTIQFTCNYEYPDMLYIYFKLSSLDEYPITAHATKPSRISKTKNGAVRTMSVLMGHTPCNVECHIVEYRGRELIKVVTSITTGLMGHANY